MTKTTYIIHPHSNMPQMQPAPASLQEMMGQDFSLELRRLVSCSCHEVKHETARPCIRNQKRSQTISYKSTKFATLLMKVMQTYANSKQQTAKNLLGFWAHFASLTETCLEERPNRHRESWTAAASGCQRSGAPAVTETDGL